MIKCDYKVIIPDDKASELDQDKEYCILKSKRSNAEIKIGFHEYSKIYSISGLYEYLFCDRLKCASPHKIISLLSGAVGHDALRAKDIRVLDFGAGNGIVGEQLKKAGVPYIYGVDVIKEAKEAAERDRPGIYEKYFLADFTSLSSFQRREFGRIGFNLMTIVGSLGFGDIPIKAFCEAFNLLTTSATVAFNLKESFLSETDLSGFSCLVQKMIDQQILSVNVQDKYRHRYSIAGTPIYYIAFIASKKADIPVNWFRSDEA